MGMAPLALALGLGLGLGTPPPALPLLRCSATVPKTLRCRWRWRCAAAVSEDASGALPTGGGGGGAEGGRQRRRLRQQRREAKTEDPLVSNWREQLEDRLLHLDSARSSKSKTTFSLAALSQLGPQWWALHVSPNRAAHVAASLASTLSAAFPLLPFKLYNPSVRERSLLTDGFVRVKHRPLRPGILYLHCVLDRHVHHIVETAQGVSGFMGSQVPVRAEQFFTKPKPVSSDDMEAILLEEKQEQEAADKAFQQKQLAAKRPPPSKRLKHAYLLPGVSIRVLSGPFADYTGSLKQLNLKKKKATVELLLFGKESSMDLDFDQIEAVTA